MAGIYKADIYCDDCTQAIKADLDAKGTAPTDPGDESSWDSDDYPKYADDDAESDTPQHCRNHENCCNAHTLPSGRKIGVLIGTSLTQAGVEYVKESIDEDPRSEVVAFWREQFTDAGYDLPEIIGPWEKDLTAQAEIIIAGDDSGHRRGGQAYPWTGWYLNIKDYRFDSKSIRAAIQARWEVDDIEAMILRTHEQHQEQFIEDADECFRYSILGDESGKWPLNTSEWHEKTKTATGGRSGGWLTFDWAPLREREAGEAMDPADAEQFRALCKNIGKSADYWSSVEAFLETIEATEEPETREEAQARWIEEAKAKRLADAAPALLAACQRIHRALNWSTTEDRLSNNEMAAMLEDAIQQAE